MLHYNIASNWRSPYPKWSPCVYNRVYLIYTSYGINVQSIKRFCQAKIIHAMLRMNEGSERIWYLLVGMDVVMDLCGCVRGRFRMVMITEILHEQDLLQRTRYDFVSFFTTLRWWCINNDAITRKVGYNNIANRFRGGTESCKAK